MAASALIAPPPNRALGDAKLIGATVLALVA